MPHTQCLSCSMELKQRKIIHFDYDFITITSAIFFAFEWQCIFAPHAPVGAFCSICFIFGRVSIQSTVIRSDFHICERKHHSEYYFSIFIYLFFANSKRSKRFRLFRLVDSMRCNFAYAIFRLNVLWSYPRFICWSNKMSNITEMGKYEITCTLWWIEFNGSPQTIERDHMRTDHNISNY